jgi:hypothetical protein
LTTDAVLKVCIPLGIEGIGVAFDLDVANNSSITGYYQCYYLVVFILYAKYPIPVAN